ncbi:MAG TPA: L,D-transpeptidase [Chitinophagaceae bacterium]|jgi:murein L,D-transpeptidase YafK|nr:L,D-transpeptidase [Chitinophagaceae bacterium]
MKTAIIALFLLLASGVAPSIGSTKTGARLSTHSYGRAFRAGSLPVAPVKIVIDKSEYELHVYDTKGWYASYPVVFGLNPMDDKKMEGDRRTPEGSYEIVAKRPHEKWARFLALNYPTKEDLAKFNQRKQRGEIPARATPGGGIGIHGTFEHEDFVVDRYKNWTNGCISLKRDDVADLYRYISVGTPVTIRK